MNVLPLLRFHRNIDSTTVWLFTCIFLAVAGGTAAQTLDANSPVTAVTADSSDQRTALKDSLEKTLQAEQQESLQLAEELRQIMFFGWEWERLLLIRTAFFLFLTILLSLRLRRLAIQPLQSLPCEQHPDPSRCSDRQCFWRESQAMRISILKYIPSLRVSPSQIFVYRSL